MANVKISALPAATTPLAGTEVLPIVQSGVTVNVAVNNLTAGRAVALGATTITGALSVSGITTVAAGTAALPAIVSTTGTADTGLWFPAADTVAASTAGTERFRIDSSGNVGIGGSPFAYGAGYVDLWIQASTTPVLDLAVGSTRTGTFYASSTAVNFGAVAVVPLILNTANTERMRIDSSGNVLVTSVAGLGYGTGSGGTVTQATSKSTGVTLNKPTGQITMNAAALASGTIVSFVLTNTVIAATDLILINHVSGGTGGAYTINGGCAAGGVTINVRNSTAGSLSEALVLSFAIIKGVTA